MNYKAEGISFDECIKHAEAEISEFSTELPHTLYHYTNTTGMLGIIDSKRLWATHFQYLNDASELEYGYNIAKAIIQKLLATAETPHVKTFLEYAFNSCSADQIPLDIYITCLCEQNDVLNQWRVYGGISQGYALGFRTNEIGRRRQNENIGPPFIIRKVLYDENKQHELISNSIQRIINALNTTITNNKREETISDACNALRQIITKFSLFFKHPAFAVEHEWRLLHVTRDHEDSTTKFKDGFYGLTPYVELDISPDAGPNTDKLPLRSITAGPSRDPRTCRLALKKLIEIEKLSHCYSDISSLPVRT